MRNHFVQQNKSIHDNQDFVVFVRYTKMMPYQRNIFDIFRDLEHDVSSKQDNIPNSMNTSFLEKDTDVGFLEEALTNHTVKLPAEAETYLRRMVLKEVVVDGNIVFHKKRFILIGNQICCKSYSFSILYIICVINITIDKRKVKTNRKDNKQNINLNLLFHH